MKPSDIFISSYLFPFVYKVTDSEVLITKVAKCAGEYTDRRWVREVGNEKEKERGSVCVEVRE